MAIGPDDTGRQAYLGAAVDVEVSQVVDRTTGVHALVRTSDVR